MTPDEALSIVDTKAAGRTRFAGMEPYADEVLAAEVRRLRERMPAYEWERFDERFWRLFVVAPGFPRFLLGCVFEHYDGTAEWGVVLDTDTPAPTLEEAKRQLLEYAQSKCQKP